MADVHPALAHLLAPLDALHVNGHPYRADADAAAKSLAVFGQRTPIVADTNGAVLAGVEWYAGALRLGWTSAAVLYVDDDATTATAYMLAALRVPSAGHVDQHDVLAALEDVGAVTDDLVIAAGYTPGEHLELRRRLVPDQPTSDLLDGLVHPELALQFKVPDLLPARAQPAAWRVQPSPRFTPATFRTLLSYWYYRTDDPATLVAKLGGDVQLFADCGAFSAKMQGAQIDRDEYVAWLTKWAPHLEAMVNLDVIGDPAGTCANQHAIEAAGVDALPVFHGGEDWRYLEDYCEQYPYVCLGGMVGFAGDGLRRWIAKAFTIAAKHGTVLHGFGQARVDMLLDFPWYSVDTSSWGAGHRYGLVDLWDDEATDFVTLDMRTPQVMYDHADLVRAHGLTPAQLDKSQAYHYHHAVRAAAAAWHRFEQYLRRRHGPIAVRDHSRLPGLHLYLVDTDSGNLGAAANHVARYQTAALAATEEPE